jgi:hypothetical protein
MTTDSTVEPHLVPHVTDRGFTHLPEIAGTYPETNVRAYESSAASQPCIWLNVTAGKGTVHLTVEDALRLADQLQHLARNHYQLNS